MADFVDQIFCEEISKESLNKYNQLGKNGKPDDKEWAVLACILKAEFMNNNYKLEVVSLGTGSKCIGASLLPLNGDRLHDSHAEIIAQRAFKVYLLDQVKLSVRNQVSIFIKDKLGFALKENISFHFYCSQTPCGDASCFLKLGTVNENTFDGNEDSPKTKRFKLDKMGQNIEFSPTLKGDNYLEQDIYITGAKCVPGEPIDPKFSESKCQITGALRTKPGKGDPTLSHSCSDKLFKWTTLGVQGSLLMLFLSKPIYIESITVGACPYNSEALQRAIYSRFKYNLKNVEFIPPFRLLTPKLFQSVISFHKSKFDRINTNRDSELQPSATSIIWYKTSPPNKHEVSVEGKRLGTTKKNANTAKGRVSICRIELLKRFFDIASEIKVKRNELKFSSGDSVVKSDGFKTPVDINNYFNWFQYDLNPSMSYGEFKDMSITYKNMSSALQQNVLTKWIRKPSELKNFKLG